MVLTRRLTIPQLPGTVERPDGSLDGRAIQDNFDELLRLIEEGVVRRQTVRVSAHGLRPQNDTTPWATSTGYLYVGTASASSRFYRYAPVLVPGAIVTGIRARMYRSTSSEIAAIRFRKYDDTPSLVSIPLSVSHTGTGWATVEDVSTTERIAADHNYFVGVELKAASTATDARILWFELDLKLEREEHR